MTRTIVAATCFAACLVTSVANAEPVKIALIESLSGGQAVTGKLFQSAVKYGLAKVEAEKAWPDGIKLLEYDNQGGPSEAADKLKAAINDGAQIIIQGASSAIGGQITADVQKHNARNPGKEIMWINVGAEAMEFTGPKCHFYHFRWNGNAEIRLKAMLIAMKDANALGTKVYIIGQNYSWGHDVQKLTRDYAKEYGYTIVGDVIHDVNKIQDFAPYVAKIKEAGPDTVVTGNWSNDLLLLMKAAGDSGLKARFLAYWIDQPGNIANAGDTADGHYTQSTFFPDANGEKTAAFAEDFKAKTGQYPLNVQGHVTHAMWGLGEALKALKAKPGDKLNVKALASAMENVTVDTSMGPIKMRSEDHQALVPLAIAVVSKDAKFKADNTERGFKTIKLLTGEQASSPVQPSCKMDRPKS
ncbi:ABC transporter substrate-binding protein [Reyranella soli]|uniref:ABC transporter substrate-binding protein n=1 Tax=Reyranella soli TaxID=1230389 RepID=UPI0011BEF141|nr:ABC transporter substrate-binding protein [Reyranella soli]